MGGGFQFRKFYAALAEELVAFASQEFRGARIQVDGSTERQHDEAAERIRAGLPKKKRAPISVAADLTCPWQMAHLWRWFLEILSGASGGGMGPVMVAWIDIRAWADLTGEVIEPWEARLLLHLSVVRAEIVSENGDKGQDRAHR